MKIEVTAAQIREAALLSLDLTEGELGTAVLKTERSADGDWDLLYADSAGTFEGLATIHSTGAIDVWWDQDEFDEDE